MSNNVIEYILSLKDRITGPLNKVRHGLLRMRHAVNQAFLHPIQTLGRFKAQLLSIAVAMAGVGVALKKAFDFESMRVSFGILFRDMGRAKQWVDTLKQESASTPFQMAEYAQASKYLHVFTDGALNTVTAIRKIGDAAAATGNSIKELSFWMGRAYGNIQAGRPSGEAFMRLQEMGILPGSLRNQLEDMQKGGASGEQIWGKLMQGIEQYKGGMETLSQTGNGLMSTLKDNWSLTLAQIGEQFAGVAKNGIKTLIEWLQKLRDSNVIEEWGNKVKNALSYAGAWIGALKDQDTRGAAITLTEALLKNAFLVAVQAAGDYLMRIAPVVGDLIRKGVSGTFDKIMSGPRGSRHDAISELEGKGKITTTEAMLARAPLVNSLLYQSGISGRGQKERVDDIEAMIAHVQRRDSSEKTRRRLAQAEMDDSLKLYGEDPKMRLEEAKRGLRLLLDESAVQIRKAFDDNGPMLPDNGPGKNDAAVDPAEAVAAAQAVAKAEAEAKAKVEAEKLAQRKASLTGEYNRYMVLQGVAQDRLSRAQMAVQQAWGEFKDPEMFKRNQQERDKESEVRKEWETKWRERAERLSKKPEMFLSDREKAAVRYLKAEKEQQAAEMALKEIAANTKRTNEIMESLLTRS